MAHWIRVAAASDCPPGSTFEVVAGERIVALANVDGQLFALDGVCPHQGGPLGKGTLDGPVLTCPWHGWQFDCRTGQHGVNPSLVQPSLSARVEGDAIMVDVGDEA